MCHYKEVAVFFGLNCWQFGASNCVGEFKLER
jgi:hypothetical protein